ncbi:hypothetical protein MCP1_120108 [Candidatus Terasakiella magnetica]|nr:hypothetical protein MCP1_120108 [Candidatus Terasakiella magnetica]
MDDDMYAGLLTGDSKRAETKTLLDADYARLYAANIIGHLRRVGLPAAGGCLDMGCGAGVITDALRALRGGSGLGVELSPAAVTYASARFPLTRYHHGSADELSQVEDASLGLVHAREMYPYSRTMDADLHTSFLAAALPKLMAGGIFAVIQVRDPSVGKGLHNTLTEVQSRAKGLGYRQMGVLPMVPQRVFARLGPPSHSWPVFSLWSAVAGAVERRRPGSVSFVYWFKA